MHEVKGTTDTSLRALGECCKNLEAINLYGCVEITDDGLIAVGPWEYWVTRSGGAEWQCRR